MPDQANIDTLIQIIKGFNEDNIADASGGCHPDLTYIVRGRASVSGTYRGVDAFAAALRRIKALTNGTMTYTPEVILSEGDVVMTFARITGRRADGRTYDNHHAYLYRFHDAKLLEGQSIPVDQYAFDAFFAD